MHLAFCGPEAVGRARGLAATSAAGTLRVVQEEPCRRPFAETRLGRALLAGTAPAAGTMPDAFALFNPGLHAGKYAWRRSMEAVLGTGLPLLLTAYSDQDAASDARWLAELGVAPPAYQENPWASREGWGGGAETHANRYFAVVHGRGPADAAGHAASGHRRAPSAPAVPTEGGWARRRAMADLFGEGPSELRRMLAEWSRGRTDRRT